MRDQLDETTQYQLFHEPGMLLQYTIYRRNGEFIAAFKAENEARIFMEAARNQEDHER